MSKKEEQGEGMEKKEQFIRVKKKGGVVETEERGRGQAGKVMFSSLKKAQVNYSINEKERN